jgi:hypothetical protein
MLFEDRQHNKNRPARSRRAWLIDHDKRIDLSPQDRTIDQRADEFPVDCQTYLREINHPITIPMATPTARDPTTVSTGCRSSRFVVSSKNSSAASPACFATRRAAPKPSSTTSAIADVRRDALRAVSAICSLARPTTVSDIVSLLSNWMLISIGRAVCGTVPDGSRRVDPDEDSWFAACPSESEIGRIFIFGRWREE